MREEEVRSNGDCCCGDSCTGWYCCEDTQEVFFVYNCDELEEYLCDSTSSSSDDDSSTSGCVWQWNGTTWVLIYTDGQCDCNTPIIPGGVEGEIMQVACGTEA